jgi:hypothetical protein
MVLTGDDAAIALETDAAAGMPATLSLGDDEDDEKEDVAKDSAAGLDDDDNEFSGPGPSQMDDEIPGDCTGTLNHDVWHSNKCPQPIFNPLVPHSSLSLWSFVTMVYGMWQQCVLTWGCLRQLPRLQRKW